MLRLSDRVDECEEFLSRALEEAGEAVAFARGSWRKGRNDWIEGGNRRPTDPCVCEAMRFFWNRWGVGVSER